MEVSIVMPVYNVQNYLRQCLQSLKDQTLTDFEVLCVDDGSSDDSPKIVEEFAAADPRFHLLRQDHQGAGPARNLGIEQARGEYLMFLDSDDFFAPELLSHSVAAARKNQADIVLFDASVYDETLGQVTKEDAYLGRRYLPQKAVFNWRDIPERILQVSNPTPWNKLYRREFVQKAGLQYQNLPNTNDIYFTCTALVMAERITALLESLVYYRVGQSSLQRSKDAYPLAFAQALRAIYDKLQQLGVYPQLEKSFLNRAISGYDYNLSAMRNNEARQKMYQYLLTPEFQELRMMEKKRDYYFFPAIYDRVEKEVQAARIKEIAPRISLADCGYEVLKLASEPARPLISVIIPFFNTEAYLSECIESVLNQSLREIEVVCMDDGSTDGSLALALEYAQKDSRVTVLKQQNSGQSVARNNAMQLARGEYLQFMDSDDFLCNADAYRLCVERAKADGLDYLEFDAENQYEQPGGPEKVRYVSKREYPPLMTGPELLALSRGASDYRITPCVCIYRRAFLQERDITFYPGIVYEDNIFSLKVHLEAQKTARMPSIFYMRRVRAGSTTYGRDTQFYHVYSHCKVFVEMQRLVEQAQGLTEDQMSRCCDLLREAIDTTRRMHAELPQAERGCYRALSAMDELMYSVLIAEPAEVLENSRDYTVGHALLKYPRKAYHLLKRIYRKLKKRMKR